MKRICIIAAALFWGLMQSAFGQGFSVSSNILELLNMGCMGIEAGIPAGRHLSVNASVRYNPWTVEFGEGAAFDKKRGFSAGARYWPWHINSGWWLGAGGSLEEYSRSPLKATLTEEGQAFGATLSAGYSWMLHPHFNIDFGAGAWGGIARYTSYECSLCGSVVARGRKRFLRPSDLRVSLVYVF